MSGEQLVVELRRIARNEVSAEVERRETAGLDPMTAEDREMMARSILRRELKSQWQSATQRGGLALTPNEESEVTEAVVGTLFSALPGLDEHLARADVTDIFVNGCDDVRLRLVSGDELRVAPIASSDDELVALVQGPAAAGTWHRPRTALRGCRVGTRRRASRRRARSSTCSCPTGPGWPPQRG